MGYSQTHYNTHVSFVIQQFSLGCNPDFMFILTHKITEDHLTLSDGGLHTLSRNMVVTFFELYFCVYSIQKWDLIRQKLEIAAGHHPQRSISKLFLKLAKLEKIFENSPSKVMTG